MEESRCKRCGVWVYDGSPLCPTCSKRHNEVYNHSINHIDKIVIQDEPRVSNFKIIFVIGLVFILIGTYFLTQIYRSNYVDISSFPPHAHVFEFDEYLFRTKTNSPLEFETEGNFGYFVKIVDVDTNNTIISFFLHPNKAYELSIPVGNYIFAYGIGKEWVNILVYFGDEGKYFQTRNIYQFIEEKGYTIRLMDNGNLDFNELELDLSVYN